MAIVSKDKLKGYFERGDRPNEEQFIDLIDSMYSKKDDHDFTANTIVSTGGTTILTCKEDGGHMGTLYVDTLFVAGGEYDPGSDVPSMYGYKFDPDKHSFAELDNDINKATGNYSHAEGYGSSATTSYSHAEGYGSKASGLGAHAEGGYGSGNPGGWATGTSSHAEGVLTTASTPCSHAEGYKTYACGNEAHTEGDQTIAYSHAAHAEGSGSTASGDSSHAEGKANKVSGVGAHAEGSGTTATGDGSHAGGIGSVAQYATTFVHGFNITGSSDVSGGTYVGKYGNIPARQTATGKYLIFSVSNGDANTNKNRFEVFTDGNISINEGQMVSAITTAVTSSSTDYQLPTAKACWAAITGNGLTQTTGDNRYLLKKSTINSDIGVGWGSKGLTINGTSTAESSHGLLVGTSNQTYIRNGYIDTAKNLGVSGNTTVKGNTYLKSGTTANTLTTTGDTKLYATTANTLTVTGNTYLKSGTTGNTLMVTGGTTMKSGATADTLTVTGYTYLQYYTHAKDLIVSASTTMKKNITISGLTRLTLTDAGDPQKTIALDTNYENQYIDTGGYGYIKLTGNGGFHNSDPNIHIIDGPYAWNILFIENATNKTIDIMTGESGGNSRIHLFSITKGNIGIVLTTDKHFTVDGNRCFVLKRIMS